MSDVAVPNKWYNQSNNYQEDYPAYLSRNTAHSILSLQFHLPDETILFGTCTAFRVGSIVFKHVLSYFDWGAEWWWGSEAVYLGNNSSSLKIDVFEECSSPSRKTAYYVKVESCFLIVFIGYSYCCVLGIGYLLLAIRAGIFWWVSEFRTHLLSSSSQRVRYFNLYMWKLLQRLIMRGLNLPGCYFVEIDVDGTVEGVGGVVCWPSWSQTC